MSEKKKDVAVDLSAITAIFEEVDMEDLESSPEIQQILAALALPEAEFEILQEYLLNNLEKSLNLSPSDKLAMVYSLQASGVDVSDLNTLAQDLELGFSAMMQDQGLEVEPIKLDFLKRFFGLIIKGIADAQGLSKQFVPIPIEKVSEKAIIPTYANAGDAGLDLYAIEDTTIAPGETKIVGTGIKIALPLGYQAEVRPRSGVSSKTNLRIANSPGTIDSNYRGEIGVIITNIEPKIVDIEYDFELIDGKPVGIKVLSIEHGKDYTITEGMRFAQLVITETPTAVFQEVSSVGEIGFDRGGGFGSTGE